MSNSSPDDDQLTPDVFVPARDDPKIIRARMLRDPTRSKWFGIAPVHGWDNDADLAEGRAYCENMYGYTVRTNADLPKIEELALHLRDFGISEKTAADLIRKYNKPPFKKSRIEFQVWHAYEITAYSIPGQRSFAQFPDAGKESGDTSWLEGGGSRTPNVLDYDIANTLEPEKIDWLWTNRFAKGKVSLVAGFPEQGKSQITLSIAATVSTGGMWPNVEGEAEKGAVIILSSEDTAKDTIVPRLIAAGADLNQIIIIKPMVKEIVDGKKTLRVLNIADDLDNIKNIINKERDNGRDVKLIVLDPLNAYFGGPTKADSHKSADMRALLTPIATWADESKVAIIGIMHFNKGSNSHTLYRVTDSGAITAVARSVWFAVKEEATGRLMMLRGKNNIGPPLGGIAYTIEVEDIGGDIRAPRIMWDGPVTVTADEALGPKRKGANPNALIEAEEWLRDYLNAGPQSATQVLKEGRAHGHSTRTLQRAKDEIGVESKRDGGLANDGKWQWELPSPADDFEDDDAFG